MLVGMGKDQDSSWSTMRSLPIPTNIYPSCDTRGDAEFPRSLVATSIELTFLPFPQYDSHFGRGRRRN